MLGCKSLRASGSIYFTNIRVEDTLRYTQARATQLRTVPTTYVGRLIETLENDTARRSKVGPIPDETFILESLSQRED